MKKLNKKQTESANRTNDELNHLEAVTKEVALRPEDIL
jgi:hypothetical protein